MTYSIDLKIKILRIIRFKKFTNQEIMDMFKISKKTFYGIRNDYKLRGGSKYVHHRSRRKTKITNSIKSFIIKYVIDNINFDNKKLISIIKKKYDTSISTNSIYRILRNNSITKKKFPINSY